MLLGQLRLKPGHANDPHWDRRTEVQKRGEKGEVFAKRPRREKGDETRGEEWSVGSVLTPSSGKHLSEAQKKKNKNHHTNCRRKKGMKTKEKDPAAILELG